MGSRTLAANETQVSFHRDNPYDVGRPAVNVKVYGIADRAIYDLIETVTGEANAQQCFEVAEAEVFSDFWDESLPAMAESLGFEVEQEGRSGGWVVVTNQDPMAMEGEELKEFLRKYRILKEFCFREVAEAPGRIGARAQEFAIEKVFRNTVTYRSIKAFDPDLETGCTRIAKELGFATI